MQRFCSFPLPREAYCWSEDVAQRFTWKLEKGGCVSGDPKNTGTKQSNKIVGMWIIISSISDIGQWTSGSNSELIWWFPPKQSCTSATGNQSSNFPKEYTVFTTWRCKKVAKVFAGWSYATLKFYLCVYGVFSFQVKRFESWTDLKWVPAQHLKSKVCSVWFPHITLKLHQLVCTYHVDSTCGPLTQCMECGGPRINAKFVWRAFISHILHVA